MKESDTMHSNMVVGVPTHCSMAHLLLNRVLHNTPDSA